MHITAVNLSLSLRLCRSVALSPPHPLPLCPADIRMSKPVEVEKPGVDSPMESTGTTDPFHTGLCLFAEDFSRVQKAQWLFGQCVFLRVCGERVLRVSLFPFSPTQTQNQSAQTPIIRCVCVFTARVSLLSHSSPFTTCPRYLHKTGHSVANQYMKRNPQILYFSACSVCA